MLLRFDNRGRLVRYELRGDSTMPFLLSPQPYLQEKSRERGLSAYQRIYTIYRLIANFLPKSPVAAISEERWADLRAALEIRNRIVHPTESRHLELNQAELNAHDNGP